MAVFSDNNLGRSGCRLILQASINTKDEDDDQGMTVVLENCGASNNETGGFNPAEPSGFYELDMSEATSQSIFRDLLIIVAKDKGAFVLGTTTMNGKRCALFAFDCCLSVVDSNMFARLYLQFGIADCC